MKRALCVIPALLVACGPPPIATFEAQRAVIEARPPSLAERGWWRYLAGDDAGAEADFAAAGADPLAALGRARLAQERLDRGLAAAEAAQALEAPGLVGRLAREAHAALAPKAPRPWLTPLEPDGHTLRISFHPLTALSKLQLKPPREEGSRIYALGKPWAMDQPRPNPDDQGVILTRWPLAPGPARLRMRLDGPLVAWRDGRIVMAAGLDHLDPPIQIFDAPGEGPLLLAWASKKPPKLWRVVEPPEAPPLSPPPVPERRSVNNWVTARLAATEALALRDVETTEAHLAGAPALPRLARLRASALRVDPSAPKRVARDAERASLEGAQTPAERLARGRLHLRGGRLDAAEADLEAARATPSPLEALKLLARLALQRGEMEQAQRYVDQATLKTQDPCALLDLRAALTDGGAARAALATRWRACKQPLKAAQALLELHKPQAAMEALGDLGGAAARAPEAIKIKARALIALDRLEEASEALKAAEEDAEAALLRADLSAALGAEAPALDAAIAGWTRRHLTADQALDLMAARAEWSPFEGLTVDTEAAIEAFEARPPLPGPAVRVLDHSALIYLPTGQRLRWVHEILCVRSREAAEAYGEIGLPEGARLVALYNRKADGRRLDAEESPEKETLSLPDLKVDDYVVAAYLERGHNGALYDGALLTPRVLFGDPEIPVTRKRLEVFAAEGARPTAHGPLSGEAVEASHLGGAGLRLERLGVDATPDEPHSPPPAFWMPWIRVGRGVHLDEDLRFHREQVMQKRRRTGRLDAWIEAAAGSGPMEAQIKRLSRKIREAVEPEGGLTGMMAPTMLMEGAGSRALLLSAALEHLHVPHQLVLARPKLHIDEGPFVQVVDYNYPLLKTPIGWIDPGPDRAPVGFVPGIFRGGDGLVLWPHDDPEVSLEIPEALPVTERREVEVEAEWLEDGRVIGRVVDRIEGQEGIVVGGYLARAEPAQRPKLLERLLIRAFGAARVTEWSSPSEAAPDGPLILEYRFEVKAGEALNLGLFPSTPGRTYATLTERALPLWIGRPIHQIVRLRLSSARPFEATWRRGAREEGRHRFSLEGEVTSDRLEVTSELYVHPGIITPEAYTPFAEWARGVDLAERLQLKR